MALGMKLMPLFNKTMAHYMKLGMAEMSFTHREMAAYLIGKKEWEKGAPRAGEPAPDFEVEKLTPTGDRTGEMFRLSSNKGKPLAMVMGSYTWPPFREYAVRMNNIYEKYKDRIEFLCVYIREAHPEDGISGYPAQSNVKDDIFISTHTNIEERAEVAQMCVLRLNLKMPMALDNMRDQVDQGYRAMPERLAVIDAEGKIAYISAQGPWGFLPDEWEAAIEKIV